MKLPISFNPHDLWVGVFWKIKEGWGDIVGVRTIDPATGAILTLHKHFPPRWARTLVVYICLLPMVPIRIAVRWPFRGRSAYARTSDPGGGHDFQVKSSLDGPPLDIESVPPPEDLEGEGSDCQRGCS